MNQIRQFRDDVTLFLEKLRSLTQDELGCECPEHVFEQARILRGEASPGKTSLAVVVGERLLIVFADYESIAPFEYEMPRLILAGVTYRDSMGLNKLRLVISGGISDEHRALVEKELTKYDERVVVHYFD
jgi:hypothetical protein